MQRDRGSTSRFSLWAQSLEQNATDQGLNMWDFNRAFKYESRMEHMGGRQVLVALTQCRLYPVSRPSTNAFEASVYTRKKI